MDSIGGIFWAGNLFVFSCPNLLLDLTAKDSTSVLLNYFSTSEEITFSLSGRSVVSMVAFMMDARFYLKQWLDSNFIPMDSKKFGFWNFDYIIRFAIKNESEIEKLRSRDWRIFEKNRFYEIKTLTHNNVNTVFLKNPQVT